MMVLTVREGCSRPFSEERKKMNRNRLVLQILLVAFLASLPGIAGAAGTSGSVISPVNGVSLNPDVQTKYIMAGGGNEMTIVSGKVNYSLEKGSSYKFKHGEKEWKVLAKENTTGYVQVKGEDLDFVYNADQLIVAPLVAAAGGTSGTAVAVGTGAAAAVAGGGAAMGLSTGHGGAIPPVSPQ
jgi:hypothetical protein